MGVASNVLAYVSRAALALRAGVQFNGARDLYKVFGYRARLDHRDFLVKYLRQDIAYRIIHAPVDATWTDPPVLRTKKDGKVWKEWEDLVQSQPIYPSLRKADIFAGLGMYSILIVGLDDGRKLDLPVNTMRKNTITYLQPYLESSIRILSYEENTSSPRFGKPLMYEITPGEVENTRTIGTGSLLMRKKFTVHHSRVLHLAEDTLEDQTLGHSRLERIYNVLDDILKVVGGSAETYWLTANRGMQVDVDKEMELSEEDQNDLAEELDEYMHQLRRVIRTRGVKINNLGSDVADPKNEFGVLLALLSAATGIPQRVLMGAEAGQLASQQDRANWAVQIAQRVANYTEPYILRPFIKLLMEANVLSKVESLHIDWPEPFIMNPLERAQTSAQMARSAVNVARTLEVQQNIRTDILSVEEARSIIAPGDKMPIFTGKPVGTFPPPPIEDPTNPQDPAKVPDPDVKRPEEERGVNK